MTGVLEAGSTVCDVAALGGGMNTRALLFLDGATSRCVAAVNGGKGTTVFFYQ